jgi:hypothetical protein
MGMTRNEVQEGSVVDLLARIARERSRPPEDPAEQPDVVEAGANAEKPFQPPTLLFPGAPRRRRR